MARVVLSPAAMGRFKKLPREVFERIIKELCVAKLDDFDSVAVKDLQNVRLVSTAFREITTPILFENIVWDQRFLRHKDIRWIIEFVGKNPHLAKYVKRLQLRVPPIVTAVTTQDFHGDLEKLRSTGTSRDVQRRYLELMIVPLREWRNLADDPFMVSGRKLEQLYQRSFQLLPKLEHIETATSTYYYEYLAMSSQRLVMETGILMEDYDSYPGECIDALLSEAQSLADAFALIPSTAPLRVNSFKFCHVPLIEDIPNHCLLPTRIQHLDLEFKIPDDYRKPGDGQQLLRIAVNQWRQQLKSLSMLRTLRLSLVGSWNEINNFAIQKDYPFYIDNLLPACAPDNIHATNGGFTFLTDLKLCNLPINPLGLRTFILKHRATLQRLSLRRVSLDARTDIDWIHVIRVMSHLHNLSVLELWRIGTHYMSYVDEEGEVVDVANDEQARGLSRAVVTQILGGEELEHLHDLAGGGVEEVVRGEVEGEMIAELEGGMVAELEGEAVREPDKEWEGEMTGETEDDFEFF